MADFPDPYSPEGEWLKAVLVAAPVWQDGKNSKKGYWYCQVNSMGTDRRWFLGPLGEAVDMFNKIGLNVGSEFEACCPENFRIDINFEDTVYSSKDFDRNNVSKGSNAQSNSGGSGSGGGNRGGGGSGSSGGSPPPRQQPNVNTDFPALFSHCFNVAKGMVDTDQVGQDAIWRIAESLFTAEVHSGKVTAPPAPSSGGSQGAGGNQEEDDLPF